MTEAEIPIERVQVAIGHELDRLAVHYGVPFRKTGESDDTLRKRIWAEINRDQSEGPSDAELAAVVREAIEAWKTARELPYLSPEACKVLNDLIVAGLRPIMAATHEAGRREQREDDGYGER